MKQAYCVNCKTEHGNNYFPLVVPVRADGIKAFINFAKKCDCITCASGLYNINKAAFWYKIHKQNGNDYSASQMRADMKYFQDGLVKNVGLHVVEACHGINPDGRTAGEDAQIKAHFGSVNVYTSKTWRERHLNH